MSSPNALMIQAAALREHEMPDDAVKSMPVRTLNESAEVMELGAEALIEASKRIQLLVKTIEKLEKRLDEKLEKRLDF